ncbi:MAG: helix-turn-helix domain-containing protein [Thermoleophilaceae bacterium]
MTQDDVLCGYRLQLFDLAGRTTVSHACRTFGVHRSTYYRWKRQVERSGLEMLRPRERRRPHMPNQFHRSWRNASWPSRSVIRASVPGGSLLSSAGRPGCRPRPMASGGCCAGTGSTPGG